LAAAEHSSSEAMQEVATQHVKEKLANGALEFSQGRYRNRYFLVKKPQKEKVDGGANFIAYTIEVGVLYIPLQSIRLTIGNDVKTTIFGIYVIQRSSCTIIPNFTHPSYS